MNQSTLDKILKEHNKFLRGEEDGKRTNLHKANLEGANLRGADLELAYLYLCKVSL